MPIPKIPTKIRKLYQFFFYNYITISFYISLEVQNLLKINITNFFFDSVFIQLNNLMFICLNKTCYNSYCHLLINNLTSKQGRCEVIFLRVNE